MENGREGGKKEEKERKTRGEENSHNQRTDETGEISILPLFITHAFRVKVNPPVRISIGSSDASVSNSAPPINVDNQARCSAQSV